MTISVTIYRIVETTSDEQDEVLTNWFLVKQEALDNAARMGFVLGKSKTSRHSYIEVEESTLIIN